MECLIPEQAVSKILDLSQEAQFLMVPIDWGLLFGSDDPFLLHAPVSLPCTATGAAM